MYSSILLSFTLITLIISFAYFFMFSRGQERFMQFWGFSWVAYSFSLLCLIIFLHTDHVLLLEVRKLIDMLNILLLLLGVFAFMHVEIPTYWYRFSLYMVLLAAICIIYQFDLLSFYLPISLFQIAISIVICYNIFRYWSVSSIRKYHAIKYTALLVFLLWGVGKSLLSLLELYYTPIFNLYISEIVLSNILNFCILTIYIQNTREETGLTEHLYKTVVENASDAIFYYKLSPYRSFEYVTPSITQITGYAPSRFYKEPRLYMRLVKSNYLDQIKDVFDGNIQHDAGQIFEFIKKSGESFWGEINVSIIYDGSKPVAVEGMLRDITVMKSVQMEQITAKQSRDLLLSYVSHELRTPVTSIAGYLTALNEGVISEEDEVREAMDTITSKTILLKKLIDDLDQLSKLETHQFSFDFMTHPVTDLADSILNQHFSGIEGLDLTAKIDYDKKSMSNYWVVADEDRINQVFSNILDNARKYSSGQAPIHIALRVEDKQNAFVVSITNTGKGIAKKDLAHIFDRFYRAGSHTASSGRGLGLAISKEIIKSHNGIIYAESQEDKLTTFTFTIPLFKEVLNGTGKDSDHR